MITFQNVVTAMMYYSVYNFYKGKVSEKHLINYISFFHAISSFILCYIYFNTNHNKFLSNIIVGNTGGYYLYDAIDQYVKFNNKFSISYVLYLYHHIVSLYTFNNYNVDNYKLLYLLYFAEMANIPTKCVYYLLTEEKINKEKYFFTNVVKIIQLLSYLYVRIYKVSAIVYDLYYNDEDNFPLYLNIPMVLLGYLWTWGIYQRTNFRNILKCKLKVK